MFASISNDQINKLSTNKEWLSLLHADQNNQIHLPAEAFMSKEANSKNEIKTLLENINPDNVCQYPGRYSFLSDKLDLNISFDHCKDLNQFIEDSSAPKASIVFVSSFLSSPSSYFGHIFLKTNKTDNSFFSQTISYAAEVPKSTGFFGMIKSGIGGDFNGTISVAPYFKLLESYNVNEQRNIEEYELNLNEKEVNRLILHTYELLLMKDSYKFFANNCATELLWLLNVAKPEANIMKYKRSFDTPYSVVKSAIASGMLVNNKVTTREAMIDKMSELYFSLTSDQKSFFTSLITSKNKTEDINKSLYSQDIKNKIINLLNLYNDFMFKKYGSIHSDFNEIKALGVESSAKYNNENLKSFILTDLEQKHESKVNIGFESNEAFRTILEFKPALMNRSEDKSSEIAEVTLEFLNIGLLSENNIYKINNFDLFKLESYNEILPFYKQPSWRLYSGIKRDNNDQLMYSLEAGLGATFSCERVKMFVIPQLSLNSVNMADLQVVYGLSYWLNKTHFEFNNKSGLFNSNENENTFKITQSFNSFYLNISKDLKSDTVSGFFGIRF